MSYSYSPRTGGLARDPIRTATGSAPSGLNSPHLAAALAQIDRAFGPAKSWEDMTPGERRDAGAGANARIARALDREAF